QNRDIWPTAPVKKKIKIKILRNFFRRTNPLLTFYNQKKERSSRHKQAPKKPSRIQGKARCSKRSPPTSHENQPLSVLTQQAKNKARRHR
ncbi:MAG: hypothetical protein ACKN9T_12855, partial [Candidatus Methylumidiphilus sp.]